MCVRLAPPVAGRRDAHQAGVQLVLDITLENAVLDQRGALRRRAFVIDAERASAIRQGAVIDDGAQAGRHLLADPAAVGRAALAIEITLQAVTDGLVQQHPGPARPKHDRQGTGRRRHRFEVDQRLTQCLTGVAHGATLGEEVLVAGTPAAALATALTATVLLDDHADVETHQRADIGRHATVHSGHQDMLPDARQAHRDLLDPRVQRPGRDVDALEQLDLLGTTQAVERIVLRVQRRECRPGQHLHPPLSAAARDGACSLGCLSQGIGSDRVTVGETGFLAGQRAHADALLQMEASLLDDAILEHPGLGNLILKVQVRRIHAGPGELTEQAW